MLQQKLPQKLVHHPITKYIKKQSTMLKRSTTCILLHASLFTFFSSVLSQEVRLGLESKTTVHVCFMLGYDRVYLAICIIMLGISFHQYYSSNKIIRVY